MRRRNSMFLTLALVAGLGLAGCGEDNGGGDDEPGATATPVRTATPTVAVTQTVTPTSDDPQTPTPTPTGPIDGTLCGPGPNTLTIVSGPGADLDTGWTGIAHDNETPSEVSVTVQADCDATGATCTVDGSALVGQQFGAPLPLSSGGVPVCVINTFREAVGGEFDCANGCGTSDVLLESRVFLVQDIAKPCPLCVGDPTPNDGNKDGTCESGTTPGVPCDVGAVDPNFGQTSLDCLPTGSSVGELEINLSPTTTGTITVNATVDCISPFFPPSSCYCPGQIQPNACTDGVCTNNSCASGPIDGLCSGARFRSCRSGTGTTDCESLFPGSGSCIDKNRPCFTTTITATGECAPPDGQTQGELVAFFCVPETRTAAINTTAGLPGPGLVQLRGTAFVSQ